MTSAEMFSKLDNELFRMLTRPVDANDIADVLRDLRMIKFAVRDEMACRVTSQQPCDCPVATCKLSRGGLAP